MAESIMEKVRRFAGADPAVPDAVLEMCYAAAVEWYKAAGVQPDPEWDLWVFWACNLAAWMYDNRGNADANAAIPVYIVTSVHQLRTGKPTEEGNAGSAAGDPARTPDNAEASGTESSAGAAAGTTHSGGDPT